MLLQGVEPPQKKRRMDPPPLLQVYDSSDDSSEEDAEEAMVQQPAKRQRAVKTKFSELLTADVLKVELLIHDCQNLSKERPIK